jgi:hypothetical protein
VTLDKSSLTEHFNDLVRDGNYLLALHGTYPSPSDIVGWELACRNLLNLTFAGDDVFLPTFLRTGNFPSQVAIFESAAKEFEKGFAGSGIRREILRVVYTDLSTQADALVDAGYLRAAAVLGRVSLERQLRELGRANGLTDWETKKAAALNQELRQANVYNQSQWNEIQSWLDMGNAAAHNADFEERYKLAQVQRILSAISSCVR